MALSRKSRQSKYKGGQSLPLVCWWGYLPLFPLRPSWFFEISRYWSLNFLKLKTRTNVCSNIVSILHGEQGFQLTDYGRQPVCFPSSRKLQDCAYCTERKIRNICTVKPIYRGIKKKKHFPLYGDRNIEHYVPCVFMIQITSYNAT
jgi:hypothetical protein